MAHTYTSLLNHFIFSTKDRAPVLDVDLKEQLFPHLGGTVRELGGAALSIDGPTDHVQFLASLPATIAPSEFAGKVKANSSGWVSKAFPRKRGFEWQVGNGAFSVSVSRQPKVVAYIANQEEHHRKLSFEDKYLGFLKKHGIAYDEQYVFD